MQVRHGVLEQWQQLRQAEVRHLSRNDTGRKDYYSFITAVDVAIILASFTNFVRSSCVYCKWKQP